MLRVTRILKLLSLLNNADVATSLISETMREATTMLSVFLFFVVIVIVFFGCLVYLIESGTYTVNSTYPNGAYLRRTHDDVGLEITPFLSIPVGIYWAIGQVTGTGNIALKLNYFSILVCLLKQTLLTLSYDFLSE